MSHVSGNKKAFSLLGTILVLLFLVAYSQRRLSELNKSYTLTESVAVGNSGPVVEFTSVALGGFRGIIADILYMRIQQLQNEERFYEIPQISSWIVALQPQFTKATSFIATDMAWNISALYPEPNVSWEWINRGIHLLRNEALLYRPEEPVYCENLLDIYLLRIMGTNDTNNREFKARFCNEYKLLFGEDRRDRESVVRRMAEAPNSLDELKGALGGKGLGRVSSLAGISTKELTLEFRKVGSLPDKVVDELEDEEVMALDSYLRRQWVVETYRMDISLMRSIEETYGAVDWAMPNASALYWAVKGLLICEKKGLSQKMQFFEYRILITLRDAFQYGSLLHSFNAEQFQSGPNLKLAAGIDKLARELIVKYPDDNDEYTKIYRVFLRNTIATYYGLGKHAEVSHYLAILNKEFPLKNGRNPHTFPGFLLNLEMKSMDYRLVQSKIYTLISQAFWQNRTGNPDEAGNIVKVAELYHRAYKQRVGDESKGDLLPSFGAMKQQTVKSIYQLLSKDRKKRMKNE